MALSRAGPGDEAEGMDTETRIVPLPAPRLVGDLTLEAALARRRTVRDLAADPLTEGEIGQLLWAAQGVTHDEVRRTAPSASSLFPLEVFVATAAGLAHYVPERHALERLSDVDLRPALQAATGDQPFVSTAPLVVLICAVPERLAGRHGPERAVRYAAFEAGHAGQNLLLQAEALGLAGVPIGSFRDAEVGRLLDLPAGEEPLYLFAVGRPR
jgi:SagB-type dehydrogenase family enzyme